MTTNDQAAQNTTVAPAKDGWVKPEITSFAAAVEAQGAGGGTTADGGANTAS